MSNDSNYIKTNNSSTISSKSIKDYLSNSIKSNKNWFAIENIKLRNKIKNLKIKYEKLQRNLNIKCQLLKNRKKSLLIDNYYLKLDKLLDDKKIRRNYKNSLIQTDITFPNHFFVRWDSYFDNCEIKKISSDSEIEILKKTFFKKSISEFRLESILEKKSNDLINKRKKEKNENKYNNIIHDRNFFSSVDKESSSNLKKKNIIYKNLSKSITYIDDKISYMNEVKKDIKDEIRDLYDEKKYIYSNCNLQRYLNDISGNNEKRYNKNDDNNSNRKNDILLEKKINENPKKIPKNCENIANIHENNIDKNSKAYNLEICDEKIFNAKELKDAFYNNANESKNENIQENEEFNYNTIKKIILKRNKNRNNEISEIKKGNFFINLNEKNKDTGEISNEKYSLDTIKKKNTMNETFNNIRYNKNEIIERSSKIYCDKMRDDMLHNEVLYVNNKDDLNYDDNLKNKNIFVDGPNLNNMKNNSNKITNSNYCNLFKNDDTLSIFSEKKKKIEDDELNGNKDNYSKFFDKNIILNRKSKNIESNYIIKEHFDKKQNADKNKIKLEKIRCSKSLQENSRKFSEKKERYIDILLKNTTKNCEKTIVANNFRKAETEFYKNKSILNYPLKFKNKSKESSFRKSSSSYFKKSKNQTRYSLLNHLEKKNFNTPKKLSKKNKQKFYNHRKFSLYSDIYLDEYSSELESNNKKKKIDLISSLVKESTHIFNVENGSENKDNIIYENKKSYKNFLLDEKRKKAIKKKKNNKISKNINQLFNEDDDSILKDDSFSLNDIERTTDEIWRISLEYKKKAFLFYL
ncbi:conserved Plasmodium protein, unknown function [Plasmodium relictum]|uniref:Uncharacterized protein n=1 Tax=Plasmodium relictum TaxID=85471 RepID=A0A1J1H2M2_PLARL|nr:conserved Plasmodium protein, unknown function [Plasmodium relictum]CRG99100.1 conserved Plasmodium protein, unknown function [Plasmodium relictum]